MFLSNSSSSLLPDESVVLILPWVGGLVPAIVELAYCARLSSRNTCFCKGFHQTFWWCSRKCCGRIKKLLKGCCCFLVAVVVLFRDQSGGCMCRDKRLKL